MCHIRVKNIANAWVVLIDKRVIAAIFMGSWLKIETIWEALSMNIHYGTVAKHPFLHLVSEKMSSLSYSKLWSFVFECLELGVLKPSQYTSINPLNPRQERG